MEYIYVGSSCNYESRKEYHMRHYEEYPNNKLYKLIRINGGWDNHILIELERREDHIGLIVIERFWYDCISPIGNVG